MSIKSIESQLGKENKNISNYQSQIDEMKAKLAELEEKKKVAAANVKQLENKRNEELYNTGFETLQKEIKKQKLNSTLIPKLIEIVKQSGDVLSNSSVADIVSAIEMLRPEKKVDTNINHI